MKITMSAFPVPPEIVAVIDATPAPKVTVASELESNAPVTGPYVESTASEPAVDVNDGYPVASVPAVAMDSVAPL